MKDIIKSYAKINMSLHVVKKMKNGYHKLKMINTLIDLYDEISFEPCDEIVVSMSKDICLMEDNLCYKIALYLKNRYQIDKGIKIFIDKHIPDGGGLGGGSSDAACVLEYLNECWNLKLSKKQMINIAKQFGCDIPFFINKNISYVKGYGEKIKTLKLKENNSNILLVIPNFKINTKVLYQNFKEFRKDRTKLFLKNIKKGIYIGMFNDLETTADKLNNNKISELKKQIENSGVTKAVMSGSGSTIVGYIEEENKINEVKERIISNIKDVNVIITKVKMYTY